MVPVVRLEIYFIEFSPAADPVLRCVVCNRRRHRDAGAAFNIAWLGRWGANAALMSPTSSNLAELFSAGVHLPLWLFVRFHPDMQQPDMQQPDAESEAGDDDDDVVGAADDADDDDAADEDGVDDFDNEAGDDADDSIMGFDDEAGYAFDGDDYGSDMDVDDEAGDDHVGWDY
mmetsp:Transcript_23324/g.73098  ORF Transcript_23324/g.73098 Transcript_23324/m.73098 type:complete len:173 (-) Transcript_23324:229-747(-)